MTGGEHVLLPCAGSLKTPKPRGSTGRPTKPSPKAWMGRSRSKRWPPCSAPQRPPCRIPENRAALSNPPRRVERDRFRSAGRNGGRGPGRVMRPTLAAQTLRDTTVEYLTTTFALAEPDTQDALEDFLTDPADGLFRGPYLRIRRPFEPALWCSSPPPAPVANSSSRGAAGPVVFFHRTRTRLPTARRTCSGRTDHLPGHRDPLPPDREIHRCKRRSPGPRFRGRGAAARTLSVPAGLLRAGSDLGTSDR